MGDEGAVFVEGGEDLFGVDDAGLGGFEGDVDVHEVVFETGLSVEVPFGGRAPGFACVGLGGVGGGGFALAVGGAGAGAVGLGFLPWREEV